MYEGYVVEESLIDNRIINELKILSVRVSMAENPEDRWHVYKVNLTDAQIEQLAQCLKQGEKWYAHFWNKERKIKVIFSSRKIFEIDFDKKETWKSAVEHGISLGIPIEQLDFPID